MATKRKRAKPSLTHTVTTGSTIRIEQPSSERGKPGPATVIIQEVQEANPAKGFVEFLRKHAIVGLSIGFIIGNQMSAFVKILVENVIDPMTKLFFGTALSQRTLTLHFRDEMARFGWGVVVYNLIIILLLLLVIYAAVKFFALDKLDKKEEDKDKK
jgi:large-conductance mechanosensitive channel